MDIDFQRYLGAVKRSVTSETRDGKPARAVVLQCAYDTGQEDLWDAVTVSDRIGRWFAPVDGQLQLGGRFQIKDNAAGSVTACAPPERYDITWEFGGDTSWVTVELTPVDAGKTRLKLTHLAIVNPFWNDYGPGAVGVGWELGLMGLALHLEGLRDGFDETAFGASDEGKRYVTVSAHEWGEADVASGADPEPARAAALKTAAFYRGDAPPAQQ